MKILFIGGNGNISWNCVQKAIECGHEVYELNRAQSIATRRAVQPEVKKIIADRNIYEDMKNKLAEQSFDVVCDFICYNEVQAKMDVELFEGKVKQFIFISSEAVYERFNEHDIYSEDSARYNPETISCTYTKGKILAEDVFMKAYRDTGFPVTILRPGYTYDTIFPISIGHNCFTAPYRILEGYPLLITGSGEHVRSFTHSKDFADVFIKLLGNKEAIGEAIQVMSEEYLSWSEQSQLVLESLKVNKENYFHVPAEDALKFDKIQSLELAKQRMYDSKFNMSKLHNLVPNWTAKISFEEGIKKTVEWLYEDKVRMRYVKYVDDALMYLYEKYGLNKMEK